MKFRVISEQPVKQKFVLEGEKVYLARLTGTAALDFKIGSIESSLPRSCVIALDENGTQYSSEKFAAFLQKKMVQGTSSFSFLIGGPSGHRPEILAQADQKMSLSPLTFTYQMSRLILVEQVYRAICIMNGKPYHKE